MKGIRFLLAGMALLLCTSCEKEVTGYRDGFTGDFLFTTVVMRWHLNTDSTGLIQVIDYDTIEFRGFIRKYEPGDDAMDLYPDLDTLHRDSAVFIQFLEQSAITTLLKPDGTLVPRGGYHYGCSGAFQGRDFLEFSVIGLGGLGGGWNYYVTGSRK